MGCSMSEGVWKFGAGHTCIKGGEHIEQGEIQVHSPVNWGQVSCSLYSNQGTIGTLIMHLSDCVSKSNSRID